MNQGSFLKSVAFIAEEHPGSGEGKPERRLCGTGFFLGYPGPHGFMIPYFVTARHVIDGIFAQQPSTSPPLLRVNERAAWEVGPIVLYETRARWVPTKSADWIYHPDRDIDVAIYPLPGLPTTIDHLFIPSDNICPPIFPSGNRLAEGTDLLIPGLFDRHDGISSNVPVLRLGTLAAIPHEKVRHKDSFGNFRDAEVLIAEIRSIGGLSGSPVITKIPCWAYDEKGPPITDLTTLTDKFFKFQHRLLGLMSGHWDAKFLKDPNYIDEKSHIKKENVNLGLAFITPAKYIVETLEQPHAVEQRQSMLARIEKESQSDQNSSVPENARRLLIADIYEPLTDDTPPVVPLQFTEIV